MPVNACRKLGSWWQNQSTSGGLSPDPTASVGRGSGILAAEGA